MAGMNRLLTTPIDLRSDTVTRPTAAMRAAIAAAEVGDDQYGEDPTTARLQAVCAELLDQEAALWLPTGTMANQVALRVLTRPGDEVLTPRESHAAWHETGGAAANAGVQMVEFGHGGRFTLADIDAAVKPTGLPVFPPTTLLQLENTHNRAGGIVLPQDLVAAACSRAREHGLACFLDGARLWNAAVASGRSEAELAAPFDLVAVAFSKGLGAPGGSLLAGHRDLIRAADRHRRMMGGAMRQNGLFAAAALHGLVEHRARLAEDHAHAREFATLLASCPAVQLDLDTVQSNIVVFHLRDGAPDAATVVGRARELGVLLNAFGPRLVRAVTHLDVDAAQVREAAQRLLRLLG
jgi:threonine aldolase